MTRALMKLVATTVAVGAADPEPFSKTALLTVAATTAVSVVVADLVGRGLRKIFD